MKRNLLLLLLLFGFYAQNAHVELSIWICKMCRYVYNRIW